MSRSRCRSGNIWAAKRCDNSLHRSLKYRLIEFSNCGWRSQNDKGKNAKQCAVRHEQTIQSSHHIDQRLASPLLNTPAGIRSQTAAYPNQERHRPKYTRHDAEKDNWWRPLVRRVRGQSRLNKCSWGSAGCRRLSPRGLRHEGESEEKRDVNEEKTAERYHHAPAHIEADHQNAQSFASDDTGFCIIGRRGAHGIQNADRTVPSRS
jgi:hypothetical protein